jgi:hypothetical protein
MDNCNTLANIYRENGEQQREREREDKLKKYFTEKMEIKKFVSFCIYSIFFSSLNKPNDR